LAVPGCRLYQQDLFAAARQKEGPL